MTKPTSPPPPGMEAIRRTVLLSAASSWLGFTSYMLVKELNCLGYPILGNGRGRRAYIDDLLAVQYRLEQEARERIGKVRP